MTKKFGRKYKRYHIEKGDKGLMIYDNEGLDDYYFINDEEDFQALCDRLNEYEEKIKELKR